jgi:hypothetical protein
MATASYLDRLLEPLTQAFTPRMASVLLDLRADSELEAHIDELRRKANSGTLTPAEEAEYRDFVEAVDLISIMQVKARRFLAKHSAITWIPDCARWFVGVPVMLVGIAGCRRRRMPQAATPLIPFHVEHFVSRQHGGTNDPSGLALVCDRCNAYKGPNLTSVDPDRRTVVALFSPRRDVWSDHFVV